ncbi:Uu.00g071850.m01.CDS01 [Anthostomella pinea]|uniref:Uu.00g071850.m01.CDS01 n=1 Tax=Anthostomella pinea TaxID=933095 RepID=A0AAI8VVL3_9PEZI|nr:Uu.00g071850.m01.CDS01 [Anthostomella pinea]
MVDWSAPMPDLLYGTAWKEDQTAVLVEQALKAGFRGIDTAAQPRHYNEALVGSAVRTAVLTGVVEERRALFIQTKFTPIGGQDLDNLSYDPTSSLEDQVHASVMSSLGNFDYIDCLILHSPLDTLPETVRVWKALETYVPHCIRRLGISNTTIRTLDHLCTDPGIRVRPACVQNRFSPATRWDIVIRAYCRERDIKFQAFWILTGNPELLASKPVLELAEGAAIGAPIALYALVLGLQGTAILSGTTDWKHMNDDLKVTEVVDVFSRSESGRKTWSDCLSEFKKMIGEVH